MKIPPVSHGSSQGPFPIDWQQVCDSMMSHITGYIKNQQPFQCDGYLSTILAFSNGLGSSSQDRTLQYALGQFDMDVSKTFGGQPSNWIQDLQNLRGLFPNNLQDKDIQAGFASALNSVSEIMTGSPSGEYVSGFGQMMHDLLPFASPKIRQILTSEDFQIPLNNFINNPVKENQRAFVQEIQNAIANL